MRPQAIASFVLATLLSSCSSQHLKMDKFQVGYEIRYDPRCVAEGQSPPPPTTVMVDPQSTALNVMEAAVVGFDPTYRFSATYFGEEVGYFIDRIGNATVNADRDCFWVYYVISTTVGGGETLYPPSGGVSNFFIPANGTRIAWTLLAIDQESHNVSVNSTSSNSTTPGVDPPLFLNDTFQGPDAFLINYIIYASMPACPVNQTSFPLAITVSIPRGGVVLNVMERARDINPEFAFSATYFGVTYGYFIDMIGETTNNDICAWTFLYEPPGYDLYIPTVGVSNFVLPVNAGTVFMIFAPIEKGTPPPTIAITPTEESAVREQEDTVITSGAEYKQPSVIILAVAIYTMTLMLLY